MKPDTASTYSMTSSEGTRTSMSRVTRWSSVQALALASLAFICTAVFAVAALPGPDGGGDPTVGTLPMLGKSEGDFLDQTLTLRGFSEDIEAAIIDVGGNGAVEKIDLGNDRSWIRYYGHVQIELDLASLANIEVEIFTGFEGRGLSYVVGQANGFGTVRRLASGGVIRLDPIRFANAGLLDQTLFVAGFHRIGQRTMTSLERRQGTQAQAGSILIRQDV
jgi:hypothetical protein